MAAWRRKADRLLPELREELSDEKGLTPGLMFFSLLEFVRDAHRRADDDALRRAYGLAQWCHHQRDGSDLPNAVAVCFYEHLFDDWSLRHDVIPWLSPGVRQAILVLWERRLSDGKAGELRSLLKEPRVERWRELRAVASDL